MNLLSAKQAGAKWGISARRVAILCSEGRIEGAQIVGNSWAVPADAEKPVDARVKSGRYIKSENKSDEGKHHG